MCAFHLHDGFHISQQLHVHTQAAVLRRSRSVAGLHQGGTHLKQHGAETTNISSTHNAIMRSANSSWNMITARLRRGRYDNNFSTTGDEICDITNPFQSIDGYSKLRQTKHDLVWNIGDATVDSRRQFHFQKVTPHTKELVKQTPAHYST